ncbi:hypothetical protein INR49_008983 [Caranx melampygus]|nr:hypothetical protein INR49_008983 [Caranx melampygus]
MESSEGGEKDGEQRGRREGWRAVREERRMESSKGGEKDGEQRGRREGWRAVREERRMESSKGGEKDGEQREEEIRERLPWREVFFAAMTT